MAKRKRHPISIEGYPSQSEIGLWRTVISYQGPHGYFAWIIESDSQAVRRDFTQKVYEGLESQAAFVKGWMPEGYERTEKARRYQQLILPYVDS